MIIHTNKHFILRDEEGTPQSIPSTKAAKIAVVRQPNEEELKTEFTVDPEMMGPGVAEVMPPTEKEKKEEKLVEKEVKFVAKVKAPEEKKKEEVKKVEPAAKIEPKQEQKKGPQLIVPLGAQKKEEHLPEKRDYAGFNADETKVLEKMSNEAFTYTTNLIKERRELEKLKGQQFVQHPRAYTLDPEYEKIQEDVNFLKKEADYWQTQLINSAEGKDWQPITGWDKQGNPILGQAEKATTLSTERLRMAVNNCLNGATNRERELQQFTQTYQQRMTQDEQNVDTLCAQYFGWCADPKMLDMAVNTGEKDETVKEIRERFLGMIAPHHRNTQGYKVAAHMFAALQIYGQKIRELENGKHVAEVKADEVLRAEPLGNRSGEQLKQINGVSEFSLEGLPT